MLVANAPKKVPHVYTPIQTTLLHVPNASPSRTSCTMNAPIFNHQFESSPCNATKPSHSPSLSNRSNVIPTKLNQKTDELESFEPTELIPVLQTKLEVSHACCGQWMSPSIFLVEWVPLSFEPSPVILPAVQPIRRVSN